MPQSSGFFRARRRAAHSVPSLYRAGSRSPRSVTSFSKRFAYAQPRALLGAMMILLCAGVWWAAAQNGGSASGTNGTGSTALPPHVTLQDLPSMVVEYGARRAQFLRQQAINSSGTTGLSTRDGFTLTESDLTPHTPSDEREPAYSPSGATIAFASNGRIVSGKLAALNSEKRYHIFVINRDGTGLRQITGLGTDINRDQRHPAWAPDGQQLVYTDTPIVIPASTTSTQLFVVRPFDDTNTAVTGIQVGTPEQRTFTAGRKLSPTWSATGLRIAFASDYDLTLTTPTALGQLDIFTIAPTGEPESVVRLTGGTNDPLGNTTDDINPCYATANVNLVFFSSNRAQDAGGNIIKLNNIGRRIWFVNDVLGALRQVTDSRVRAGGRDSDRDDYPSVSNGLDVGGTATADRIAFQTDTYIDTADVNSGTKSKDFNVWTLTVNSVQFQPTATPTPQPSPVFVVSGSASSTVGEFNAQTGAFRRTLIAAFNATTNPNGAANPSGIAYYDINNDGTEDILVANRNGGTDGAGRVDAYSSTTGAFIRTVVTGTFNTGSRLTNPSFLKVVGNTLYVGSGAADPTFNSTNPPAGTQGSGNGVYRFTLPGGAVSPGVGAPAGSARFTNGEPLAAQITNGVEGFDFDTDGNLYVAAVNDDFINEYSPSGTWVATFVTEGSGGLSKPTGVRFTLDNQYLLVASNATDQIKRYDATTGDFVDNLVSDTNGATRGLNSPYGIEFNDSNQDGTRELFTDSSRVTGDANLQDPVNNPAGLGTNVLRFDSNDPNTLVGSNPFASSANVRGVTYFAFNQTARALTIVATPTPTPVPATVEGKASAAGVAQLETNLTSAPDRVPGFDGGTEDRLEDIEPAVSKSTTTNQTVSQITFVSLRTAAAAPGVALTGGGNAAPTVVNEYGGATGTHDLWTTSTRDTTPPILVPQAAGNQVQYPVLAPGIQAQQVGLTAPRTPEDRQNGAGLATNSQLVTAFVLAETESGISSVSITMRNADDTTRFGTTTSLVNENLPTQISPERKPPAVTGFANLPIAFYDDGPTSRKSRKTGLLGHERQPNAVEGDGIFYCESRNSLNTTAPQVLTPANPGDFYMDINVADSAGNTLTYDNIWGFSTRSFPSTTTATNDLFVSDYTAGQNFVNTLNSNGDVAGDFTGRFATLFPAESYYLTNPSGIATSTTTGTAVAAPTTLPNVDVYRIQCRGPISASQLAAYAPGAVFQLDPTETTNGTPGPFLDKTRRLADASRVIIWGSPYASTTFAGPGTIDDSDTQRILTNFLNTGGRLFLEGEDVIYALSNGGQVANNFLLDELQTSYAGETGDYNTAVDKLTGEEGRFTFFPYTNRPYPADYNNPQIYPRVPKGGPYNTEQLQNTYADAVAGGFRVDIMGPGSGGTGTTTTPSYTIANATTFAGSLVGQRIVRTRSSGVESRAVFFSFNFAAVNRRYGVVTINNVATTVTADMRLTMASTIRQYLKTGGLSGFVINDATNLPVPDFLIVVQGEGGPYLARTDANGFYELQGLPSGTYSVAPAPFGVQNLANQNLGFFNTTTAISPVGVGGGSVTTGNNFRVQPISPGTISGVVVDQSKAAIPNLPVLIKTADENSVFPGGGPFVQIVRTNAGGRFTFTNVPATVRGQTINLIIILNPDVADIPSAQTDTIASYQAAGGPRPEYVRRQIPDETRPSLIQAISQNTFFLNDSDTDVAADDGNPLVLAARLRKVTGVIAAQTVPGVTAGASGAKVELVSQTDGLVKQTTTTDSAGRYNFTEVAFDSYTVRASLDLGAPRNPTTPGIPTVSTYSTLRVVAGPLTPITVPGILLLARDLRGRASYNGNFANGITVQLLVNGAVRDTVATKTINGQSGTYQFNNIPAGTYVVKATFTVNGQTSTAQSASTVVTITTSSAEVLTGPQVDLFLRTITGKVSRQLTSRTGTTTTAASGATVTAKLQGTSTTLTTTTASDGTYRFADLAVGTYNVTATLPSGATSATFAVVVSNAATTPTQNFTIIEGSLFGSVSFQVGGSTSPGTGAIMTVLQNGTQVFGPVTIGASGTFDFNNVKPGTYTITASFKGQTASATVTIPATGASSATNLLLKLQGVYGRVTLNGAGQSGAIVLLIDSSGATQGTQTSNAQGNFLFSPVASGTYTVQATKGFRRGTKTASVPADGQILNIGNVELSDSASDTSGPYIAGNTYLISVPYTNSTDALSTVPLYQAFTALPVGSDGVENYQVFRYDPLATTTGGAYIKLNANSLLKRGEGYKLVVLRNSVGILEPSVDSTRKSMSSTVTSFAITLHRASSNDNDTGMNLIGSPFAGRTIDYLKSQVIYQGRTLTLQAAVSEQLISPNLTTFVNGTTTTTQSTTLAPEVGYEVFVGKKVTTDIQLVLNIS